MTKALDQIDYKIIEALRQDALKTNVQISEEIGVSEGTVRNRLRALIDEGIIKIIVTPVDPKKLGFNVLTNITLFMMPSGYRSMPG